MAKMISYGISFYLMGTHMKNMHNRELNFLQILFTLKHFICSNVPFQIRVCVLVLREAWGVICK